jgi:hypothetical protein
MTGAAMGAGIGGAAGGDLMSLAGDAVATAVNVRETKKAWRRYKDLFKRRYTYTMQDLRNAGLNPILAASLGGGSVSPPTAAKAVRSGERGGQLGSALANAVEAEQRIDLMGAQAAAAEAQGRAADATARNQKAQAAMKEQEFFGAENQGKIQKELGAAMEEAYEWGKATAKDIYRNIKRQGAVGGINRPRPPQSRAIELVPARPGGQGSYGHPIQVD